MSGKGIRVWFAGCLAAGMVAGCGHADADRTFPPDPLLQSKHPVVGKFETPIARQVAFAAPLPPPVPNMALATAEQQPEPKEEPRRPDAVPATPVSHHPKADAEPAPDVALYAHAPDYSWLQGVLERRANGSLFLRFCDLDTADRLGGKVCLEFDTRLKQFQVGQRVRVEGDVLPEADQAPRSAANRYPAYRIHGIHAVGDER